MMAIAKFSVVALDTPDPDRLAAFYSAMLGWPIDHEGADADWLELSSPAGTTLAFQLAPDHEPRPWPEGGSVQVHIDFSVPDLDLAEIQILALGATKAETQPGIDHNDSWRVYLDPDGHPFCLVRK